MKINHIFKKSTPLFLSNIVALVVGLLSAPMLISAYGIEKYGYFVSLFLVSNMVNSIFNMQPWQSMIQYWFREESASYKVRIIACTVRLDLYSAIIASFIYLFFHQNFFSFLGVPESISDFTGGYFVLYIFFNQTSFFIGVFRCFSLYKEQAVFEVAESIFKILLTFYVVFYGVDLGLYVVFLIFISVFFNVFRFLFSLLVLKNRSIVFGLFEPRVDGFFKYSFWVNVKVIIDLPISYLDRLLVLYFLGATSAGIFDLIKKMGGVLGFIVRPMSQVLLPELTALVKMKKINEALFFSLKYSKLFFVFFLVFIICFLWPILSNISILSFFGLKILKDFVGESLLYLFSQSIGISFVFIHILFMAIGRIKEDTCILFFVNFLYVLIIYFSISDLGLWSVGLSFLVQAVIMLVFKVFYIKKLIFKGEL